MGDQNTTAASDQNSTDGNLCAKKKKGKCVYLDYNGTTPIHPSVLEAMLPYFTDHFGNPSSSHHYGKEPKLAIDQARLSVLRLIQPKDIDENQKKANLDSSSIIFTGCGTESNNLAIRLALLSSLHKANSDGQLHVVTTNIEHPAITQCLNCYAGASSTTQINCGLTPKISVSYVPVNEEGIVSIEDVMGAIQPNTAIVTVMTANNEVGSIQPVFELAMQCRQRNVLFHTDAAQAVGKVDLRGLADNSFGADFITIVGHKFGAPKGIAALYVRSNCLSEDGRVDPENGGSVLLMGGGQEGGRRGGTENVPYIVGLGCAAELLLEKCDVNTVGVVSCHKQGGIIEKWHSNKIHMEKMRNRLLENLRGGLESDEETSRMENGGDCIKIVRPNGPLDLNKRLPNTLSVGLRGVQSGLLLSRIGDSVACSAGSACHSSPSPGDASYSSILKALNVPPEYAFGTLRLTVGPDTTEEDIDFAAEIIIEEARKQLKKTRSYNVSIINE